MGHEHSRPACGSAATSFSQSITLVRTSTGVSHLDSTAFPRRSLESLELLDVAPIPADDQKWPGELNLIGTICTSARADSQYKAPMCRMQ